MTLALIILVILNVVIGCLNLCINNTKFGIANLVIAASVLLVLVDRIINRFYMG